MRFRLRYQQHNLELPPGQFVIGRSTECQLSLDDPLVSRKHARLLVTEDGVFVEDLGSRNGVLVEGAKIEGRRRLASGEKVTVGSQEMIVLDADRDRPLAMTNAQGAYVTFVGPPLTMGALPIAIQNAPGAPAAPDDQSKKADAFRLLGGVADKALVMGRSEEAERILQSLLLQLMDSARNKQPLAPEVLDQAGRYGARLAGATSKGAWLDYVVELYSLHGRLLPAPVVDELYAVVRKVSSLNLAGLRDYIQLLREQAATFGPTDRFLLQRVEGLERLAALK